MLKTLDKKIEIQPIKEVLNNQKYVETSTFVFTVMVDKKEKNYKITRGSGGVFEIEFPTEQGQKTKLKILGNTEDSVYKLMLDVWNKIYRIHNEKWTYNTETKQYEEPFKFENPGFFGKLFGRGK